MAKKNNKQSSKAVILPIPAESASSRIDVEVQEQERKKAAKQAPLSDEAKQAVEEGNKIREQLGGEVKETPVVGEDGNIRSITSNSKKSAAKKADEKKAPAKKAASKKAAAKKSESKPKNEQGAEDVGVEQASKQPKESNRVGNSNTEATQVGQVSGVNNQNQSNLNKASNE